MQQDTPKDTTPRTARFSTVEFDCELPELARAELLAPKRARMLGRPPAPPKKRSWLDSMRSWGHAMLLGLLGLVFIVALCSILSWSVGKHTATPAKALLPTPVPTLTPAVVQPTPAVPTAMPEVRRAQPVPVTVKRAEQVFRLGRWNQVWMPDVKLTWVRFLGVKDTFADLPRDAQLGDSYGVLEDQTRSLWVWYMLPGFSHAAWVDP